MLLVLGHREAGGWERLAPPLAGRGWGREVAWLSAGPPGVTCLQLSAGGLTADQELQNSWEAGQSIESQGQGLHTQNPQILGNILPQARGAVWPRALLACL